MGIKQMYVRAANWLSCHPRTQTAVSICTRPTALAGFLFLFLAANPAFGFIVEGKTVMAAFTEFWANFSGFMDNPVIRFAFLCLGIFLVGKGVKDVIHEQRRTYEAETNTRQLAMEVTEQAIKEAVLPIQQMATAYAMSQNLDRFFKEIESAKFKIIVYKDDVERWKGPDERYVSISEDSYGSTTTIPAQISAINWSLYGNNISIEPPKISAQPRETKDHEGRTIYLAADNGPHIHGLDENVRDLDRWLAEVQAHYETRKREYDELTKQIEVRGRL